MTISPARLLFTALALSVIMVKAQTTPLNHEEILVKAPFAMPPIRVPVFPKRDFDVTQYNESKTSEISEAIRKAIAACHDAGGGRVVIPKGTWKRKRSISRAT